MSGQDLIARVLAAPIDLLLVLGGVLLAALIVVGLVIPRARRRARARGGGTYG